MFTGYDRAARRPGPPQYGFEKADRRVSCVYFYLWDEDFGPAFIKVCSYFPYPIKVWVNGHEWAKRQATKAGIGFTELSNGFAAADDPAGLQDICDRLGPGHIQVLLRAVAGPPARPAVGRRPRRRLLVGTVDAPGRGLAHPGVQRPPARPRVLRVAGHRQPRPGPPGRDQPDLRPADPVHHRLRVRHPGRHPRRRRHRQLLSTSTRGSSSTSRTAGRCGWRPWSTPRPTWAASDACPTSTNCSARPVTATDGCWMLNGSARVAFLRAQPLSGSRFPPPRWRARGQVPCVLVTLGSWPWPAPCACCSTAWSPSPTGACVPRWPPCSAAPTRPTR